jgi:hypothetical protein
MTLGAALLTIFMPFIALILALAMRGSERSPRRREYLKNWAFASGAWLLTGWLIAIIAFSSIAGGGSTCKGGIDKFAVPIEATSVDNVHWTGKYPCRNGGTTASPVPPGYFPT